MKLRPTDMYVYAVTQVERDALVIGLRSILEDEAGNASTSPTGHAAARILERWREEEKT